VDVVSTFLDLDKTNNREYMSRESEGGGFSEVKAILSGVPMPNFLSLRSLVAKFFGCSFG